MKIILISDTHNNHEKIQWDFDIKQADLIIHAGDATDIGNKDELEKFFKWYNKLPIQYKIFIPGNHEITLCPKVTKERPEWISEILNEFTKYENIHFYLENSGCEIEGIKFWGSPATPTIEISNVEWGFTYERYEINQIWQLIPKDIDVLITHGPPFGHCDYVSNSQKYVGCENLRYKVKEIKPLLHVFGHVHSGHGFSYDSHTSYINASIAGDYFNMVKYKPYLIDLNKENKEIKILYH